MDAEAILDQARSGNAPSEWNVWPLRRGYVRASALKWGLLAIIGFALLIPVALITIPADFVGQAAAVQIVALVSLIISLVMMMQAAGH